MKYIVKDHYMSNNKLFHLSSLSSLATWTWLTLLVIGLGACESQPKAPISAIAPLLDPPKWSMKSVNGSCIIHNGRGIGFEYRNQSMVAFSVRDMTPGMFWQVRQGDQVYQTYQSYFDTKQSADILASLRSGEKTYVEWSEFGPRQRRILIATIQEKANIESLIKTCEHIVLKNNRQCSMDKMNSNKSQPSSKNSTAHH
jgi:hypothetical protein